MAFATAYAMVTQPRNYFDGVRAKMAPAVAVSDPRGTCRTIARRTKPPGNPRACSTLSRPRINSTASGPHRHIHRCKLQCRTEFDFYVASALNTSRRSRRSASLRIIAGRLARRGEIGSRNVDAFFPDGEATAVLRDKYELGRTFAYRKSLVGIHRRGLNEHTR